MKANELRIGNWVDVNGKPCKVASISDDGINYTDETDHYEDESYNYILWYSIFDPILLTPEILEKAGAIRITWENEDFPSRYELSLGLSEGIDIWYDSYFDDFFLRSYGNDGYDPIIEKIKFYSLHQLQNIFYALTGEELEIKL
jgi:hypothetical protein